MKKVAINIDEFTQQFANTHLSTLEKAAQISPLVKERTLGPDLEPWEQRLAREYENQKENGNEKDKEKEKQKQKEKENESNYMNCENRVANMRARSEPPKTPEKIQLHIRPTPKSSESIRTKEYIEKNYLMNSTVDPDLLNETVILNESNVRRWKAVRKELFEKQKEELAKTLEMANAKRLQVIKDFQEKQLQVTKMQKEIEQEAELQMMKNCETDNKALDEKRKQTEKKIQSLVVQGIIRYQAKFRAIYEVIAKLLISYKNNLSMSINKDESTGNPPANSVLLDYNKKLRELILSFDNLIIEVKTGVFTSNEMVTADKLCCRLSDLQKEIIIDLNKQSKDAAKAAQQQLQQEQELRQQQQQQLELEEQKKLAEQLKQQQEQQRLQQEAEQQKLAEQQQKMAQQQANPPTSNASTPRSNAAAADHQSAADRVNLYENLLTFYKEKLNLIKPFQTEEQSTKYRNTCQRIVNTPINAISNISGDFLRDKYEKIIRFFSGNPQRTNLGDITINDHPLARDFCYILMAKTFVGKGYLEISSNPVMAYSVASVIVSIWKLIPDFGRLFLAYTFKESPLLAPVFIFRQENYTDPQYLLMLGYHIDKNGKMEDELVFLKRQSGIARLYAAVMITNSKKSDQHLPHPYGIDQAWLWLVNFLKTPIFPGLSATILLEMLQILSADLMSAYGKQFVKVLIYIQQHYIPKLNAVDQSGPKVRLEMLLDSYLKEGLIQRPKGILPPDFW